MHRQTQSPAPCARSPCPRPYRCERASRDPRRSSIPTQQDVAPGFQPIAPIDGCQMRAFPAIAPAILSSSRFCVTASLAVPGRPSLSQDCCRFDVGARPLAVENPGRRPRQACPRSPLRERLRPPSRADRHRASPNKSESSALVAVKAMPLRCPDQPAIERAPHASWKSALQLLGSQTPNGILALCRPTSVTSCSSCRRLTLCYDPPRTRRAVVIQDAFRTVDSRPALHYVFARTLLVPRRDL